MTGGRSRSAVRRAQEVAAYPTGREAAFSARFSHAWNNLERLSAAASGSWPSWCLRPSKVYEDLVQRMWKGDSQDIVGRRELARHLLVLDTWRQARVVVEVDPDLARALWRTSLDDAPPAVLYELPWHGLYLHLPPSATERTALAGFLGVWCAMGYDSEAGRSTITMLLDMGDRGTVDLYLNLAADGWDSEDDRTWHPSDSDAPPSLTRSSLESRARERKRAVAAVLVYLCSSGTDISRGTPVKVGRAKADQPERTAMVHQVGVRVGAALRAAGWRPEGTPGAGGTVDDRRASAAHMRRAHWHTYWTGPIKGPRSPIVHWIAPTAVGVGERITVVRRAR